MGLQIMVYKLYFAKKKKGLQVLSCKKTIGVAKNILHKIKYGIANNSLPKMNEAANNILQKIKWDCK